MRIGDIGLEDLGVACWELVHHSNDDEQDNPEDEANNVFHVLGFRWKVGLHAALAVERVHFGSE